MRRRTDDRGAALLENALVLPLVLLLLFGLFELGRFVVTTSLVTNASREAARYAVATGPGSGSAPRYADCDGMKVAAQRFSIFGVPTDPQITLAYDEGPGTGIFQGCPSGTIDPSLIDDGDRIVATVAVPYQPVIPFVGAYIGPATITRTTTRTIDK